MSEQTVWVCVQSNWDHWNVIGVATSRLRAMTLCQEAYPRLLAWKPAYQDLEGIWVGQVTGDERDGDDDFTVEPVRLSRTAEFLEAGGRMVFPLPHFEEAGECDDYTEGGMW
jgi:hypothetical protein